MLKPLNIFMSKRGGITVTQDEQIMTEPAVCLPVEVELCCIGTCRRCPGGRRRPWAAPSPG
jgi:hypothetical protein